MPWTKPREITNADLRNFVKVSMKILRNLGSDFEPAVKEVTKVFFRVVSPGSSSNPTAVVVGSPRAPVGSSFPCPPTLAGASKPRRALGGAPNALGAPGNP